MYIYTNITVPSGTPRMFDRYAYISMYLITSVYIINIVLFSGFILLEIQIRTSILNTRVYNVWRLRIKNRLRFLLACSYRNIVEIYIIRNRVRQWFLINYMDTGRIFLERNS